MSKRKKNRKHADSETINVDPAFQLLRDSLPALDPLQRASATRTLHDAGYKNREISRELKQAGRKVDEATIRLYLDVSYLPDNYKAQIAEGRSIRSVLAAAKEESKAGQEHEPAPAANQVPESRRSSVSAAIPAAKSGPEPVAAVPESPKLLSHAQWMADVHVAAQDQMREFARLNSLGAEAMRAQVLPQPQKEQTGTR